jgi:predicted O-methyltransferase YrrM
MSEEGTQTSKYLLEDQSVLLKLKETFAPDGAAEREHNARSDSAGFGLIHYGLVTNLRPERVLVIGSRHGYVPSMLALALKANGSGTIDFVDANYSDSKHGEQIAFGGVENWHGEAAEKFSCFGLKDVINFHIQRSSEFFSQCESKYGYIYLDGDHSYEGCRYDFEQSLKIAMPDALVLLHDVAVEQPGFGVSRLFGELEENLYNKILIPAWPGLGIIQRKSESTS